MKKFFALSIMLLGIAAGANAQLTASTTATASATIITPISITWVADMNFGNLAVGALGGDVDLATDGSRTPSGDVVLPVTTGTVAAANFLVEGDANATYAITLPAATVLSGPGTDMALNAYITNPSLTGTLDGAGDQTLLVGATLTIGGGQTPGVYTTAAGAEFTITVSYN